MTAIVAESTAGHAAIRRRRVERAVAALVVTVPAGGVVLAAARFAPPSGAELALLVGLYVVTMLGLTAGFHRLFSHRSFAAHPAVRAALAIAGSMAVEGPIVRWVAQHRRHHAYADRPGDPHSPALVSAEGPGLARRLWHAHVGWLLRGERTHARRFAPDLIGDPLIGRLDRLYFVWVAASLAIPALAGAAAAGSLAGAGSGLLWGGLVRIFLVHHVSWAVNSIGHSFGARPFESGDRSTNNALLAIVSFGEGWHNNHHAFPTSARHGLTWWQPDLTACFLRGLEIIGLVWNVKAPNSRAIAKKEGR